MLEQKHWRRKAGGRGGEGLWSASASANAVEREELERRWVRNAGGWMLWCVRRDCRGEKGGWVYTYDGKRNRWVVVVGFSVALARWEVVSVVSDKMDRQGSYVGPDPPGGAPSAPAPLSRLTRHFPNGPKGPAAADGSKSDLIGESNGKRVEIVGELIGIQVGSPQLNLMPF
jgi:hypothetical protein